jgi:hypothetical protein
VGAFQSLRGLHELRQSGDVQHAHHNLEAGRRAALSHPVTIRHYLATTGPLLLNAAGVNSLMLVGVKTNFTTIGGKVHREVLLRLSVRLSSGLRSLTGQIVVFTQRRLVVAPPPAQSAKENQCN